MHVTKRWLTAALLSLCVAQALAAKPKNETEPTVKKDKPKSDANSTTEIGGSTGGSGGGSGTVAAGGCSIPGTKTGFSKAFLAAAKQGCAKITVGPGVATIDEPIVALDLKNVDILIEDGLEIKPDPDYWEGKFFADLNAFQNILGVFVLGGTGVHVSGASTKTKYTGHAPEIGGVREDRPAMFIFYKCTTCSLKSMTFFDSPKHIVISDYHVETVADQHNNDGIDVMDSSDVEIHTIDVANNDDCISLKRGSSDIYIHDIQCSKMCGGVAIGSLGQYPNHVDIVKNVRVERGTFTNCNHAARLKSWTGDPNGHMTGNLTGGGGSGEISNVVYSDLFVKDGLQAAVLLDTCYGGEYKTANCGGYPTKVHYDKIIFNNIHGNTAGRNGHVAEINCAEHVCKDIELNKFDVTEGTVMCNNIDLGKDVNCVPFDMGGKGKGGSGSSNSTSSSSSGSGSSGSSTGGSSAPDATPTPSGGKEHKPATPTPTPSGKSSTNAHKKGGDGHD